MYEVAEKFTGTKHSLVPTLGGLVTQGQQKCFAGCLAEDFSSVKKLYEKVPGYPCEYHVISSLQTRGVGFRLLDCVTLCTEYTVVRFGASEPFLETGAGGDGLKRESIRVQLDHCHGPRNTATEREGTGERGVKALGSICTFAPPERDGSKSSAKWSSARSGTVGYHRLPQKLYKI